MFLNNLIKSDYLNFMRCNVFDINKSKYCKCFSTHLQT